MDATLEEVEEKKLEAIYGDDEPVPKRHRHAALASPSTTMSLKLSPLAREVAQAVRVLVEADKKADDEVEEEEEEQGDDAIDVSTSSAAKKKKKKTWTSTTTTTAPPLASPEVSAAASALERLLRALSKARQVGDTVPEAMEKALDEWREGVEASCSRLQDLLDSSPAPPRMHPSLIRRGEEKPSAAAVAAVAGPLARRLGFTSRAPLLGWLPGQPLPPEGARPPAPQEWQIGASGLRRLFAERFLAESEARAAAAAAAAAAKKAKAPPAAAAAAAAAAAMEAPPAEAAKEEEQQGAAAEAQAPVPLPPPLAAARPTPGVLPGFELVLNPDLEEVEEESSSDYESD